MATRLTLTTQEERDACDTWRTEPCDTSGDLKDILCQTPWEDNRLLEVASVGQLGGDLSFKTTSSGC